MAILNKIRQRSLFLILIIALALFSFVLSDLFRDGSAFSSSQDTVATVNGEDINREAFMVKVENMQRQFGPGTSSTQVMNRVWDQEVRKILMQEQFDELGLSVEQDAMRNALKTNFASYPEFTNEAGLFDENKLNEFIANLKAISPERAPLGNFEINYDEWVANEQAIALGAKEQAYFNMIKAGVTTTLAEAEVDYTLETESVDVSFVNIPYTSIDDKSIEVTNSDISKYINEHKKRFEVEASRDIVFVEFRETASEEDKDAIQNNVSNLMNDRVEFNEVSKLNDSIKGFRNAKDVEAFVNMYSDEKYNDAFVPKSSLPSVAQDSIFKLPVGQFYGPYKDNEMVKITKVVEEKFIPDSVKARHLLIPFVGSRAAAAETTQTEEEAKATADSLLNIIKGNRSKFVDLLDFSVDKVSNEKEGVLDWYAYNAMVPEFRDYTFENKKGDLGVVKTDFGFHVIEILDQKEQSRVIKVATLAQKIAPSETTIDNVFNATSNFEIALQDKKFQDAAKAANLEVKPVNNLKELDENIPGLGSQRSIVRWAFEDGVDVGDYKRFSVPGVGFVVAQVTAVNKKGLMTPEAARAQVTPEILKEKKAEMIRKKVTGKTVEEVAKSQNVTVSSATAVTMKNPSLTGVGSEPKVVGTAFGLNEGQTSKLIDGKSGVFMVKVNKKSAAPKLDNYQAKANTLSTTRVNASQTKAYNAIKETADIDDNRSKTVY
jgi:peptidyl-prolyl cis-trans isomerase D